MANRGERLETMTDFLFLGSKITADGAYSHQTRRWLLLERKAMANLDSVLKSKGITLLTKVCVVMATVFPVVMYRCESWTIKKAEHQRIHAFELWCWRSNLSILKETKSVNPKGNQPWVFIGRTDAKAEHQSFGHLIWRVAHWKRPRSWQRSKAGGEERVAEVGILR